MARKKRTKRPGGPGQSRGPELPGNRDGEKKLDPVARGLLLGDLVLLAFTQLLYQQGLISEQASGAATILGVVLLLWALWLQFGPKKGLK